MKINHPNITKIFKYYETNNYFIIITEYIKGGEILDIISK